MIPDENSKLHNTRAENKAYSGIFDKLLLLKNASKLVYLVKKKKKKIKKIFNICLNSNLLQTDSDPIFCISAGSAQMLMVWACFLHKGLSFLEKNAWPSRLVEHTCKRETAV